MSTTDRNFASQVIIVGGGPVGLGLAIDLAQRGITVELLERSTKLHSIPKGQNLTQRTGEHFQAWGVLDAIEDASSIPREFGNAGMVAYETLLGEYRYDWFKRGSVADYYFARNQRLPQYDTERVLRSRAEEIASLNIRFGAEVKSVEQDAEGVEVSFTSRETDEAFRLRAPYVVGCDGSRSLVRKEAGIEQELGPHARKMALLVFKSPQLHELLERFPGKSIFNILNPDLEGYWQFLGRVDLDGTWFYHAPVASDTTVENFDFAAYLHDTIGAKFEMEFLHIGFWDLRIAQAKTYRNARVFIAGDAGHSHPPYGGYGVNTGLEDARNLSWKLAATLEGWGGGELLGSYEGERLPVFASTSRDFIGRMICDDCEFAKRYSPQKDKNEFERAWRIRAEGGNSDVTQFVPHYQGSPIVIGSQGTPGALGEHMMSARAGHHLAPIELSDGRNLLNELGQQFALLVLDGNAQVADAFKHEAAQMKLPLSVIIDDNSDGRKLYKASYIFVRPDHFIAWTGNEMPQDLRSVLYQAVGRGDE